LIIIVFSASVVEIIVLVSNGVVFQNDYVSSDAKNIVGAVMILVIVCLMLAGVSGEVKRRVHAFKKKQVMKTNDSDPPATIEIFPATGSPQF
jgi:hypothetical protein